jgi:AcrR family transcriptional regulator
MGRRAIKNLEEKILQEVIRLTNKKGLESLLTREVANNLKISEPTIFSHFKTKYNLLINASLNRIASSILTPAYL